MGTENLRFPQKWQGVIFDPLLSVLGVIVIFSVWIMKKNRTLDWTLQYIILFKVTVTVTEWNNLFYCMLMNQSHKIIYSIAC